jgi:hypothetical protein
MKSRRSLATALVLFGLTVLAVVFLWRTLGLGSRWITKVDIRADSSAKTCRVTLSRVQGPVDRPVATLDTSPIEMTCNDVRKLADDLELGCVCRP